MQKKTIDDCKLKEILIQAKNNGVSKEDILRDPSLPNISPDILIEIFDNNKLKSTENTQVDLSINIDPVALPDDDMLSILKTAKENGLSKEDILNDLSLNNIEISKEILNQIYPN